MQDRISCAPSGEKLRDVNPSMDPLVHNTSWRLAVSHMQTLPSEEPAANRLPSGEIVVEMICLIPPSSNHSIGWAVPESQNRILSSKEADTLYVLSGEDTADVIQSEW